MCVGTRLFFSLCVCLCTSRRVFVRTCVWNRRFRGCCVQYRLAGGCQNGPISCVSSKIGPNTAEKHDTLRLFTALTQCVRGAVPSVRNLSVLHRICSESSGMMCSQNTRVTRAGKEKQKDPRRHFHHECSAKHEMLPSRLPLMGVCWCGVLLLSLRPPPVYWIVALSVSMATTVSAQTLHIPRMSRTDYWGLATYLLLSIVFVYLGEPARAHAPTRLQTAVIRERRVAGAIQDRRALRLNFCPRAFFFLICSAC